MVHQKVTKLCGTELFTSKYQSSVVPNGSPVSTKARKGHVSDKIYAMKIDFDDIHFNIIQYSSTLILYSTQHDEPY